MLNFDFCNPVRILFGKGQIAAISKQVPACARVLITYGGGSAEKSGVLGQVRQALTGRFLVEFGGIAANPPYETLIKAVDLARAEKVDFIIAVGGGSVIDGTKFISAAIPFTGDLWDIVAKSAPIKKAVPFGVVLTLPATGSEMNHKAVISRLETKDKLAFMSELLYPQFSVLDPTATYSLPPRQISNGTVDAFVHVVEQYLTYPSHSPLQDRFSESIMQTLIEVGPVTLKEPQNYDARANMMWCATMALNGQIGMGVPQDFSTHRIGHELTILYGMDHAQTLSVILFPNLKVRRESKRAKLLQFARRVWGIMTPDEDAAIDEGMAKTAAFFEQMEVPTQISAYKVPFNVEDILAQLERHGLTRLGERGEVDLTVSRKILELV